MALRPAGLDEAVTRLSAGTRQWVARHAGYLDSPEGRTGLPATPRVKALLQLALLCHYWRRTAPAEAAGGAVTAVVERAWRRPEFVGLLSRDPRYAPQFRLMYAAMAPPGADAARRAVLDRLAADGFLAPRRKPPYLHLETRFYADMAEAAHRLASYRELYAASVLARADGLPLAELDVCRVTHTVFYLSDFGLRDAGLTDEARGRALHVVEGLTDRCTREAEWDLAGKLVLAQHCLGGDPLRSASGAAALRALAEAQTPGGALPRRAETGQAASGSAEAFFRRSYQATVVVALAMLVVTRGRIAGPAPAARNMTGAATTATATATRETR